MAIAALIANVLQALLQGLALLLLVYCNYPFRRGSDNAATSRDNHDEVDEERSAA